MKKVQDHYFHKAKKDGFVARSAFKLEEIDKKSSLIQKGYRVMDLGCFPGSWMQYLSKKVGPKGMVLGVDRTKLELPLEENMRFLQANILELDIASLQEFGTRWDLIVSDMAPDTTGNRIADSEGSWAVCSMAMDTAQLFLRQGGACLVKSLQGVAQERLLKRMRSEYDKVKSIKPDSSRKESKEIFVLGQGKKTRPSLIEPTATEEEK